VTCRHRAGVATWAALAVLVLRGHLGWGRAPRDSPRQRLSQQGCVSPDAQHAVPPETPATLSTSRNLG
jgi:hypothetical protein